MKRILALLAVLLPFISACQRLTLKGLVITEQGEPLPSASITLKRTGFTTASTATGTFSIENVFADDTLVVTASGYDKVEEPLNERGIITVTLTRRSGQLEDVVVIAYGTTTRRRSTGSVSKLSGGDIARQPVANSLMALEGRIPGLTVTQSSGLPGASLSMQIRGQSSILQGSEPLFIIDGVPFAPNNNNTARLSSLLTGVGAGLSPFNSINPSDIESIEVLKDADATAIYGSRGANGVVLITTKKGREGKTSLAGRFSSGWSRATTIPKMLSTQEYLQVRHEAFKNDGVTPSAANAPDLLLWDTTRYTDFARLLLGGTARTTDAGVTLSGGTSGTSFSAGASWHRETTIFPGDLSDTKFFVNTGIDHASPDKRFSVGMSFNYGHDANRLAGSGGASFLSLPPNAPALYTPTGALNWEEGGAAFSNPLAFLARSYTATTTNLIGSSQVSYRVVPGLILRASLGYNRHGVDEVFLTPIASQNPSTAPKGASQFGKSTFTGWVFEPQLHYNKGYDKGKLDLLGGASWQENISEGLSIGATGYTTDALLQSLAAAPAISFRNNSRGEYRYAAFFGRAGYSWKEKYLVNLSGRRDGSSRFGPGNQHALFGALGAAWIFSSEGWWENAVPFISYGKLRASWGTTGNDQIGDYRYLDAWNAAQPYGGATALFPANLYNPSFGWEINKKGEAALDLGFLKNRLLFSAALYRNRSSNQLVEYVLPTQTGFFSITDNFPALVENKGWELEFTGVISTMQSFKWTATANLSIPRNRLLSFPGLSTSAYASTYLIGQPLTVINKLIYKEVDPATGVFSFEDRNGDGTIAIPGDYAYGGHRSPKYFGGIGNTVSWGPLECHLYFVFKKQTGTSYLDTVIEPGYIPGSMVNQPVYVLHRWQKPGDDAVVQKFTATTNSAAYAALTRLRSSSGIYSDASFARLKTVSLSFDIPPTWLRALKMKSVKLYLQGQNLFTITSYKGSDPETQNLYGVPPLKNLSAGIQFNL